MKTITITQENADKAYALAPKEFKEALRVLVGGKLRRDPFEAKSYEELCEALGIDPTLPYPNPTSKKQVSSNGDYKMKTIYEELNRNDDGTLWEPDFGNSKEEKWYSWQIWSPSAGCFVLDVTYCTVTRTYLGARLCAKNETTEMHIQNTFRKEINESLNPQL